MSSPAPEWREGTQQVIGFATPQARAASVLAANGLAKRFGDVVALDGCSLAARRGRVLGFLGANGAGKTTAMRAVFGLVALDEGTVSWDDRPVGRGERARFGYMPEERGLYPMMTAGEQLAYLAALHGLDPAGAERAATRRLDEVGLAERNSLTSPACSAASRWRCSRH
jgi:ABC-2 type transport system ATP-binding protein